MIRTAGLEGYWANLCLSEVREGQVLGWMKRYDPRFLLILGRTYPMHSVEMHNVQGVLAEAHALLDLMIVQNAEADALYGLNDVTIRAAQQVLVFVNPFLNEPTFPGNDENAFRAWKSLFLPALDHFESALSVDIEAQPILLLERKRGYSVETLLRDITEVLPEADRDGVSDFALANMQESGACLAFHRFTACGYHMARAVEDVARRYYELIKGQSQKINFHGELRDRTLAQIAGEFEDVVRNARRQEQPGLLGLITPTLRHFCRIYRDPLSHADPVLETLDANQAEIAFGHGILAISSMIEDARNGGSHFSQLVSWTTIFA